ncbi:MAG: helix-hairpin-helix domain-containing protein [Pseudomonadota bacterium]
MDVSFTDAIPLIVIGLVLLVLAVWLLMRLGRTTTVVSDEREARDVLDEGAAPAKRNQALIDAAPASAKGEAGPGDATSSKASAPTSAPEPMPSPAPAPAPAPASALAPQAAPALAPAGATGDDLTQIKGVGPKLAGVLREEGITSFAQIAAWTDSDIEAIDAKLGRFKGRITRDQWVEQTKLMISGDKSAYAEKFGQNG